MAVADELTRTLQALRQMASSEQRSAAETLLRRAADRRLRVVVAGEAKRGKSTLLNRLLGRELLPTGVLPVTAISTLVRPGEKDELRVAYRDGRVERYGLDRLGEFVSERANPNNRLGVDTVEAVLTDGSLAGAGVELVDTPGTGSVFEHNTRTARDTYVELDAVIMVVTASPPMSAAERDLLREVAAHSVRTFVVVNKADQLSADELAEAVAFTRQLCADVGLSDPLVYAMSARDADAGFAAFRHDFVRYLAEHGRTDVEDALRGHAVRLARTMRDESAVELRAVDLARSDAGAQVAAFAVVLSELRARSAELTDRCKTTQGRLRRELDESAHELVQDVADRCRGEAQRALFEPTANAETIDERGHALIERVVGESVLQWREERARVLESRLAELVERVEAERLEQLGALRAAASAQLDLAVAATIEPLPLQASRRFWLDFTAAPAVELPGAQLVRRHGFGAVRRARQRVLEDIVFLSDRQVGRVRADLQDRLDETVRRIVAALRSHHADVLTGLQAALDRATAAGTVGAAQAEEELQRLHERLATIDAIIEQLREATTSGE